MQLMHIASANRIDNTFFITKTPFYFFIIHTADLSRANIHNKKRPVFSKEKTGTTNAVLPLCFTLSSRKGPHKVPAHLCNITVATGEAYTISLQPTAHRRNSPNEGYCFTPTNSSLKPQVFRY
jgi:hypothetical protein